MRRGSSTLETTASVVLVVCALIVTGLLVRRELLPRPSIPREPTSPIVGRAIPQGVHIPPPRLVSDSSSRVRLIEFADFQCPFCATASKTLKQLATEKPGQFAIEYHHFPIASHAHARAAAEAAECAGEQHRFKEFYFVTYENQTKIGQWTWMQFAKSAGVPDVQAFDTCVRSGKFATHVAADEQAALALGIRGTPTWIVGDSLYGGLPPRSQFEAWIKPR